MSFRSHGRLRRHPRAYVGLEPLDQRLFLDGTPTLVKDINAYTAGHQNAAEVITVGSIVFFARYTEAEGLELWKTDGTAGGTGLVKDINPGADPSSPHSFVSFGGFLFFSADDGVNGIELWRSNGTSGGTILVADIHATGDSNPSNPVVSGGVLYFSATDETVGTELHRTLGTGGTTLLVEDLNPGAGSSSPFGLTNVSGTLFFSASEPSTGRELYTSGGTAPTTSIVVDLSPGAPGGVLGILERNGSEVYFGGRSTGGPSNSIFRSDGTAAGTVFVKTLTISPGMMSTSNGKVFIVEGTAYTTNRKLWVSDGTTPGTILLKDVSSIPSNGGIVGLTNLSGTMYFQIADYASNTLELWKSDGTIPGTTLVKTFDGGDANYFRWFANIATDAMSTVNGKLLFGVPTAEQGIERWISDGTPAGTVLLKDIAPGASSSGDARFMSAVGMGGNIYFLGSDGTIVNQIFKSDGTDAGTVGLATQIPGNTQSSNVRELGVYGGAVYFAADDGVASEELWRSDGTAAGTKLLPEANYAGFSNPSTLVDLNGVTLYTVTDSDGSRDLWRTDGTAAGTYRVMEMEPNRGFSQPPVVLGSAVILTGSTTASGTEVWRSDGTAAGTYLLKDIVPGAGDSYAQEYFGWNGAVYFLANNGTSGYELWKTDGTPGGTAMLKEIAPGAAGSMPTFQYFAAYGGNLYFSANDGTNGMELWRTNGTEAGTVLVADVNPGSASSSPSELCTYGGQLYFRATTSASGSELWKTDGTGAGTSLFVDINPGTGSSNPGNLTTGAGILIFSASDGVHGFEPWRSLGTAVSTEMISDIYPGSGSSSPGGFTFGNGRFYFDAGYASFTSTVFQTDGTSGGTVYLGGSSSPVFTSAADGMVMLGNDLYLAGMTVTYGRELWKYNTVDTTAPKVKSMTFDPLSSFAVEVNFTEAITAASIQASDLQITNVDTNVNYTPTSAVRSGLNGTVTYTLPASLPMGNYRFRLAAGSVSDVYGFTLAAMTELSGPDVYILHADANRDRIVDTRDFNILAANFGSSGKAFGQGNFNYDASGLVNSFDFNLLTSLYGRRIALPASALFSDAGVTDRDEDWI